MERPLARPSSQIRMQTRPWVKRKTHIARSGNDSLVLQSLLLHTSLLVSMLHTHRLLRLCRPFPLTRLADDSNHVILDQHMYLFLQTTACYMYYSSLYPATFAFSRYVSFDSIYSYRLDHVHLLSRIRLSSVLCRPDVVVLVEILAFLLLPPLVLTCFHPLSGVRPPLRVCRRADQVDCVEHLQDNIPISWMSAYVHRSVDSLLERTPLKCSDPWDPLKYVSSVVHSFGRC